jgi:hypothetical protein
MRVALKYYVCACSSQSTAATTVLQYDDSAKLITGAYFMLLSAVPRSVALAARWQISAKIRAAQSKHDDELLFSTNTTASL